MMLIRRFAGCALGLLLIPSGFGTARAAEETKAWDDYQVVVTRNIFSRVRGRRPTRPTGPVVRPVAPSAESYMRLRGIVRRDGRFIGCIEDVRSGEVSFARSGDELLKGKVSNVTLDSMVYALDGEEFEVQIGESLNKAFRAESSAAVPLPGPGAEGISGPSEGAGGPADMAEKLRQRRLRELGQ
jgi:hypothetical protein